MADEKDKKSVPPKASKLKKIKIQRTKEGRKFITIKGKPQFLPDLGNNELIAWIVKHLTKKRKYNRRQKKESKVDAAESKVDAAERTPDVSTHEYKRNGRTRLADVARTAPTIGELLVSDPAKHRPIPATQVREPMKALYDLFENKQPEKKQLERVVAPALEYKGPEGREVKGQIEAPKTPHKSKQTPKKPHKSKQEYAEEAVKKAKQDYREKVVRTAEKKNEKPEISDADILELYTSRALRALSKHQVPDQKLEWKQVNLRKWLTDAKEKTGYTLSQREYLNELQELIVNYLDKLDPEVKADLDKAMAYVQKKKGSGNSNSKDGLWTDEIERMMKRAKPIFKGVVSRDELDLLPINHREKAAFIMNLDKHTQKGSHWVAILIDPIDEKTIEYYDSFGEPMPNDILKSIKEIIDKMHLGYYLKFKENKVIDQRANSSNCGWFAMKFILDRLRGRPFRDCSGYSDVLEAERDIRNMKHEWGFL